MIRQETDFAPIGTRQTITTDDTPFALAFYEAANRAGLDIEAEVLEGAPRLTHVLTFLCGCDDTVAELYQRAFALADGQDEAFVLPPPRPGILDSLDALRAIKSVEAAMADAVRFQAMMSGSELEEGAHD